MFFQKKIEKNTIKWDKEREEVELTLFDEDMQHQLSIIQLTKEELPYLQVLQPVVSERIDELVIRFYDTILEVPHLKAIIEKHSNVERLRTTLSDHIIGLFSGQINQEYLQKRTRIAEIHFRIGLQPKWYLAAFQNILQSLLTVIKEKNFISTDEHHLILVATKIINLEQQIVLNLYEEKNTNNLKHKIEQITAIKNKMASISEELLTYTEETEAAINVLEDASSSVVSIINNETNQTLETQNHAEQGYENMHLIETKIEMISNSTEQVTSFTKNLQQSLKEISGVVQIVQDIAEQTNLLALNSAIEAARAGEHGRGFSIVAQEVRKLAEQTKHSIEKINLLVTSTSSNMNDVVKGMLVVQKAVSESKEDSTNAESSFNRILESTKINAEHALAINNQICTLHESIQEIQQASHYVAKTAEQLNDIGSE